MEAALLIPIFLCLFIFALALFVIDIPYSIAKGKNHDHAVAIRVLAWIGALFVGTGWVVALVWSLALPDENWPKN